MLLLYLHHVTKDHNSSNACPSTSQQDRTYSILQASDSRQSLLVRRPCLHMLRSDTVDRRCSQGWARWYRDCHGVDLGGGVAPCCLGHPCMLEVCLRVPMYWSIESLHGGFSVFRVPSSYSTGRVSSIHAHGMAEPCSRNSIHVLIPSQHVRHRNDTATGRKQTAPTEWHTVCMLGPLYSAFGYWTDRQTSLLQRSPLSPSPLIKCTRPVGHSAI